MAGFTQDPIQFVNLIADNLRDRYQTGFPVLKELIQNTDDAQASELHYGLSCGLPTADHALLKGPGLFFINNGRFKTSDADGIRLFGQNTKAADNISIGKFGLGMKSVFHFCEAFLFLAHDGEKSYTEVLNPWSGSTPEKSLHWEWNEFSDNDVKAIQSHLSGITKKVSCDHEHQIFILWLPLRKEVHLELGGGKRAGAIVSEYPGDKEELLAFLNDSDLPFKIAALIPLLRNLGKVAYWDLRVNDTEIEPRFEVVLDVDAKRPSLIEEKKDSEIVLKKDQRMLEGKIRINQSGSKKTLEFIGQESYNWTEALNNMHRDNLWPSSYGRDALGHPREMKDKAQPHGAVIFSHMPGDGRVTIGWSVFLPLDENKTTETIRFRHKLDETKSVKFQYAFSITLHGYFFIDAGRQGVYGLEDDGDHLGNYDTEASLRRAWNYELLRSAVLPLLLPSLNTFCENNQLSDELRTNLSEILKKTSMLEKFNSDTTMQHSWFREIKPDGIKWVLRDREKTILCIPMPLANDFSRPWNLFPALKSINQQHWLSIQNAPNILHPSVDVQWTEDELLKLLRSIDVNELFSKSTLLIYLRSFLTESAGPHRGTLSVKCELAKLVKQGLLKNGEAGLQKNEGFVKDIVIHLDLAQCFTIKNDLPKLLLSELLLVDSTVLLLPIRFLPREGYRAVNSLSVENAVFFLRQLAVIAGANQHLQKDVIELSEQFISSVHDAQDRQILLRECSDLQLLEGFDCRKNERVLVSVNEINDVKSNNTLFGFTGNLKDQLGLALNLQKILPNERVLVINADTAKLALNTDYAVAPCNGPTILQTLGQKPRKLGDQRARSELAGKVGVPEDNIAIRGLRYLLHCDQDHFEDTTAELWVSKVKQAPIWMKLWAQIERQKEQNRPWNLLDNGLTDKLSREVCNQIKVEEIQPQSIIDKIIQRGFSILDGLEVSLEECGQILRDVRDDKDWLDLPFHWTLHKNRVSAQGKHVYLDCKNLRDDLNCDQEFFQDIHLVDLSQDPELLRRQKDLIKPLNEQAIIGIVLQHSKSPHAWKIIIEALQLMQKNGIQSASTIIGIKETEWLPSYESSFFFKPQNIIDLDVAEEEVERALEQAQKLPFATPKKLHPELQEHPFFSQLRKDYFAHQQDGLYQLAQVLRGLEKYRIGSYKFNDAANLAKTARFLSNYRHPGWRLLASLIDKMNQENFCWLSLAPAMTGPMTLEDVIDLLNYVASQGQGGDLEQAIYVFNHYLRVFASTENAAGSVCSLKLLLNQEHCWRSSSELVSTNAQGIVPAHVLENYQASILKDLIFKSTKEINFQEPLYETANILHNYLADWRDRVALPLLGAFVMLFGGSEDVKVLCNDLLREGGKHSREWLINEFSELPWEKGEYVFRPIVGVQTTVFFDSFESTLEQRIRINISVLDSKVVTLFSILGEIIEVPFLEDNFDNILFVGDQLLRQRKGQDWYEPALKIRNVDAKNFSNQQLSQYLRSSIVYLWTMVLLQEERGLNNLLDKLENTSDQMDIEVARRLMLQNIPLYLKQFKINSYPVLKESLVNYRDKEILSIEFESTPRAKEYEDQKIQALKNLQRIVEKDNEAQQAILKVVRGNIKDLQYQPESVPFELFQNADDALHNLECIEAYPAKPGDPDVAKFSGICRFVIEDNVDELVFMHWGRAVNQFGSRGYPGRKKGFDRDLENMLILLASDKDESVTGKFGLGFKSVWLVSDRPTIVSGRIQATIVGGLLPVPNRDELVQNLRGRLSKHQGRSHWPGTAIHLPLVGVSSDTVLERFSKVAGVMVAFSRNIRTIDVSRTGGQSFIASWDGKRLAGCQDIFVGRIRQGNGNPLLVMKMVLKEGALLLAVKLQGFVELPSEIPHLWVTAPLKEDERLGFALNSMFEVDAGRQRLSATTAENKKRARDLGSQLALVLGQLQEAMSSFSDKIATDMELAEGFKPYQFWHSLWDVFMARLPKLEIESGSRIIATELIRGGFLDLARKHPIIPNDLSEGLQRLIRWSEIKTIIKGALADRKILQAVNNALCFQSLFDTGSGQPLLDIKYAISSDLATWLGILIPGSVWRSVRLIDLFRELDRKKAISVNDADSLGKALNKDTLEGWEKAEREISKEIIKDFKQVSESTQELRFLTVSGTAMKTKDLLTKDGDQEELHRYNLAPDDNRLANEYTANGTNFFRFCRNKLEAPVIDLVGWITNAVEFQKRCAVLYYLLHGELSKQVEIALKNRGLDRTWLAEVHEGSPYLQGFDQESSYRLIYQILKTPKESKEAFKKYEPSRFESIDARKALSKIYQWWERNRTSELESYQKATYPEGKSLCLDKDLIHRSSWLCLLLLGGFHTMGRVQPEQHRRFIEICKTQGWWDVFIAEKPIEQFGRWMNVLDEYIKEQVDEQPYEQWMMRFPIIYKLSRYLDDYVELLLGLENDQNQFDLEIVLKPLTDSDQQGGGISAPPLVKTLGIGANFVIRELIRHGVINSQHLHSHAFVPYQGVRKLLTEMGCQQIRDEDGLPRYKLSPQIFDFLNQQMDKKKVTFCGDYDIPLRIVSKNKELQNDLLGRVLMPSIMLEED